MYQLPLTFVRISDDVAICATRIVTLMSVRSYQARELMKKERQSKTLINACGRLAARTVVILDNGTVLSSPRSIPYLMKAIEEGNGRFADKTRRKPRTLRVYDAEPPEPEEWPEGAEEDPEEEFEEEEPEEEELPEEAAGEDEKA